MRRKALSSSAPDARILVPKLKGLLFNGLFQEILEGRGRGSPIRFGQSSDVPRH